MRSVQADTEQARLVCDQRNTERVMEDLIERLEKATGQDVKIDRAILAFITNHPPEIFEPWPAYTGSIDDALTLIPKGWAVILYTETGTAELYSTHPGRRRGIQFRSFDRPSVPLAICIAALRARSTVDRKPDALAPCSVEPSSAPQRDMQEVGG